MPRGHLSPRFQAPPMQEPLLCVPALEQLKACREWGGDWTEQKFRLGKSGSTSQRK